MGNKVNKKNVMNQLIMSWMTHKAQRDGELTRGDITSVWGVSGQQASALIRALLELKPNCLLYDLRKKRFYWNPRHTPLPNPVPDVLDCLTHQHETFYARHSKKLRSRFFP